MSSTFESFDAAYSRGGKTQHAEDMLGLLDSADKDGMDVLIKYGDAHYHQKEAHSCIIRRQSHVLRKACDEATVVDGVRCVDLTKYHFSTPVIEGLLVYMYSGDYSLSEESAMPIMHKLRKHTDMYEAAGLLGVNGLREIAQEKVKTTALELE